MLDDRGQLFSPVLSNVYAPVNALMKNILSCLFVLNRRFSLRTVDVSKKDTGTACFPTFVLARDCFPLRAIADLDFLLFLTLVTFSELCFVA